MKKAKRIVSLIQPRKTSRDEQIAVDDNKALNDDRIDDIVWVPPPERPPAPYFPSLWLRDHDKRNNANGLWYHGVDWQSSSPLFEKLPPEIREKIWSYCFDQDILMHILVTEAREYDISGRRVDNLRVPKHDNGKQLEVRTPNDQLFGIRCGRSAVPSEPCHCSDIAKPTPQAVLDEREKKISLEIDTRAVARKKRDLERGEDKATLMMRGMQHWRNPRLVPTLLMCKRAYNESIPHLYGSTIFSFEHSETIAYATINTNLALRQLVRQLRRVGFRQTMGPPYAPEEKKWRLVSTPPPKVDDWWAKDVNWGSRISEGEINTMRWAKLWEALSSADQLERVELLMGSRYTGWRHCFEDKDRLRPTLEHLLTIKQLKTKQDFVIYLPWSDWVISSTRRLVEEMGLQCLILGYGKT